MISGVLLLMVGAVDLIGSAKRINPLAGRALVLAAVTLIAVYGLGTPLPAVALCALLTVGWVLAMSRPSQPTRSTKVPRLWPVVLLVLAVVGITVYDGTGTSASGFLVDAYALVAIDAAQSVSLSTVIAAIAMGVFLTRSANIITLAALGRSHSEAADTAAGIATADAEAGGTPVGERNKWELFFRGRKVGSIRAGKPTSLGPALKGGRLIGPLERLLIVVLAFSGAPAIIAALAAAKGIVRFPEIAEDRGTGSKAEEFLVGSLASWSLSAFAVLYLHLSHLG